METIGTRIKNLRKKNNLTQEQLGNKLFFSGKTILSWESNRTKPDFNTLSKLSKIFNTPINYLLYGDNETQTFENEVQYVITDYKIRITITLTDLRGKVVSTKDEVFSLTNIETIINELNKKVGTTYQNQNINDIISKVKQSLVVSRRNF